MGLVTLFFCGWMGVWLIDRSFWLFGGIGRFHDGGMGGWLCGGFVWWLGGRG